VQTLWLRPSFSKASTPTLSGSYSDNGTKLVDGGIEYWVRFFNKIEVGELMVTSIDRDGTKIGFDMDLVSFVAQRIQIPLIICGGAGKWEDLLRVLEIDGVDAVAAANIFQHTDQSVFLAHKYLYSNGANVRRPKLLR
jgi:cyclase